MQFLCSKSKYLFLEARGDFHCKPISLSQHAAVFFFQLVKCFKKIIIAMNKITILTGHMDSLLRTEKLCNYDKTEET